MTTDLARSLRDRASKIQTQDLPAVMARATVAPKLARDLISTAIPALASRLASGELTKEVEGVLAKARESAAKDPAGHSAEVRAVFVLLRAQVERTAKWIVEQGTDVALDAARLEGQVTALLGAAREAEEAAAAPEKAPSSPAEPPAAPPAPETAGAPPAAPEEPAPPPAEVPA